MLGLTFKENVPDLRNTKVVDLIEGLRRRGHEVAVHDAIADAVRSAARIWSATCCPIWGSGGYDAVVGAVPHAAYAALSADALARLVKPGGLVADIKGQWRALTLPDGLRRWEL